MYTAEVEEPRLLHVLPGRLRAHVPGRIGQAQDIVETRLRRVPGIRTARANPLTGNVLVLFDETLVTAPSIVAALRALLVTPRDPSEGKLLRVAGGPKQLANGGHAHAPVHGVIRGDLGGRAQAAQAPPDVLSDFSLVAVEHRSVGVLITDTHRRRGPRVMGPVADGWTLDRRENGAGGCPHGPHVVDLLSIVSGVMSVTASIVSLCVSTGPLSLIISGAEALRLCSDLLARRTRRYTGQGEIGAMIGVISLGRPRCVVPLYLLCWVNVT